MCRHRRPRISHLLVQSYEYRTPAGKNFLQVPQPGNLQGTDGLHPQPTHLGPLGHPWAQWSPRFWVCEKVCGVNYLGSNKREAEGERERERERVSGADALLVSTRRCTRVEKGEEVGGACGRWAGGSLGGRAGPGGAPRRAVLCGWAVLVCGCLRGRAQRIGDARG